MGNEYIYPGVPNDLFAGMTGTGKIIRDAWVFELIPETETCEGWGIARIDAIQFRRDSVNIGPVRRPVLG